MRTRPGFPLIRNSCQPAREPSSVIIARPNDPELKPPTNFSYLARSFKVYTSPQGSSFANRGGRQGCHRRVLDVIRAADHVSNCDVEPYLSVQKYE